MAQNLPKGARIVELGRVRLCDLDDAGVFLLLVERDHVGCRPGRKHHAKARDRRVRRHRAHVWPHHAPHREIAQPADIGGAADGFTAQMESPGREGIAEGFAGHLRRHDHRNQHRRRQPKIAGRFEGNESHRERAADHTDRERPHADDGVNVRVKRQPGGQERRQCVGKNVPSERPHEQRGKEQPAAKAGS